MFAQLNNILHFILYHRSECLISITNIDRRYRYFQNRYRLDVSIFYRYHASVSIYYRYHPRVSTYYRYHPMVSIFAKNLEGNKQLVN
ncbi:hypothetical protein BpHYR1_008116 [Brachionus plicatilis]|uniref:Uncharacterized protein n=1 Tax=Brachionus plicatilis TaxID=10195 RepID=A0A3M7R6S7_BRAPC|nr:hypothetical protein BpHYR1_008116 [Brachionus plicatilis]